MIEDGSGDGADQSARPASRLVARRREASRLEKTGHHAEALGAYMDVLAEQADDTNAMLGAGRLLIKLLRFAEAQALLTRGHEANPDNPGLCRLAALASLFADQRDTARRLFNRLLRAAPGEVDAHVGLTILALRDGKAGVATAHLKRAVAARFGDHPRGRKLVEKAKTLKKPGNRLRLFTINSKGTIKSVFGLAFVPMAVRKGEMRTYEMAFSFACEHLEYGAAVATLCEQDRALNGETVWYHTNLGHHHYRSRAFAAADRAYATARALCIAGKSLPIASARGVLSWMPLDAFAEIAQAPEERGLIAGRGYRMEGTPLADAHSSFVVGCDDRYLRFLPRFILAVLTAVRAAGTSPGANVFCLINRPSETSLAWLRGAQEQLARMAPEVRLCFATDDYEPHDTAYYTCLRFLLAPTVASLTASRLVITDIDIGVGADFFTRIAPVEDADIALRFLGSRDDSTHPVVGRPWNVNAQMSVVRNNAHGRRFVELVRRYIVAAYTRDIESNWIIDQASLRRVADYIESTDPSVVFGNLGPISGLFDSALNELAKDDFLHREDAATMQTFERRLGEAPARPAAA